MKLFSKSTNGFYATEIHEHIPDDVVEISDDDWQKLLQSQGEGMEIVSDENGFPISMPVPVPVVVEPAVILEAAK